jgi:hypothetical protein
MNVRALRFCAWSALPFMLLYLIGFGIIARFLIPPYPSHGPELIAAFYREHANGIRVGLLLSLYAMVFYLPFTAGMSVHLKRIEGRHTPFTYMQLGAGIANVAAFIPVMYFYLAAAFRPERSPEMIQLLNDLAWLPMTGLIFPIVIQNLAIGFAVLSDSRPTPIFPRWYGYFVLWCALLYCPASLDPFLKHGPFAWNGLFTWWLSLVVFFIWVVVTIAMQLRATDTLGREEQPAPDLLAKADRLASSRA